MTDLRRAKYRELDVTLGLTEMSADAVKDSRLSQNKQYGRLPLLRQSIYSRLAGYEDVNEAERLCIDPAMRHIVGGIGRGSVCPGGGTARGLATGGSHVHQTSKAAMLPLAEVWRTVSRRRTWLLDAENPRER